MVEADCPDLVVLDVNLPSIGGFDVLTHMRLSHSVPVIMVTGRDAETDRVFGLELGADDYVVKPFSPRELASRVRAICGVRRRRQTMTISISSASTSISRAARSRSTAIRSRLTTREFELLAFLATTRARCTREPNCSNGCGRRRWSGRIPQP